MVEILNTSVYTLRDAIVGHAVAEYKKAIIENNLHGQEEVEIFFNGRWFDSLTHGAVEDVDEMIHILRVQAVEEETARIQAKIERERVKRAKLRKKNK